MCNIWIFLVTDKDKFRISEEERERLVAEEVEEFPVDNPKYTTYLLRPATNLSQSNRPKVVGQMNEIIQDFWQEHPEGTFEDWVKYYYEEHDGEDRLKEATEKAYPMVEKMRDAFDQIDEEMTHDFLRDLVLFKTYEGFDIQEMLLRKLGEMYNKEVTRGTAKDESKGIDGYIGDQPVQIKSKTYPDNLPDFDVPMVIYDENKSNKAMNVDNSELNQVMDCSEWPATTKLLHRYVDNMETSHQIFVGDSREMSQIDDNSIELVVTSPPYPMIEMWDDLFSSLNPNIETAIDEGNGRRAFELMNKELNKTWDEVNRVLVDGGIACINIGDATRKVDDSFRVYQNHAQITEYFDNMGFEPLPDILWRKPTNSAAKFMGSGMIPPNAYVTLEHEYLLIFRNGKQSRKFPSGNNVRYESAYFWEERNEWFSDVWEGIKGTFQRLENADKELRDRSAAYPLEVPYRLINMYSVYGDTVLDPFWGTGTTSLASMVAGRNSIGYEIEEQFPEVFDTEVSQAKELAYSTVSKRIRRHEEFVKQRLEVGKDFKYDAENYDFPVTTKQEKPLQLYTIDKVKQTENGYSAIHSPYNKSKSIDPDTGNQEQATLGSQFQ